MSGDACSPGIRVRGLTCDFGSVRAVDDAHFTTPPGSVTGFVGVNGSGKTTTIRSMLGLHAPTAGACLFDGHPYRDLPEPRREVGAVVDRLGAHPSHTAHRHLTSLARAAGLDAERVDAVLETVGLADVADTPVRRYSLGMTQRCAIAAALLGDPPTLILDEPGIGLDPRGIRWLRTSMREWADAGRAVLVSTHQLAELASVVDRLVVLDRGRVRFEGSVAELGTREASDLESAIFDLLEADETGAPSESRR